MRKMGVSALALVAMLAAAGTDPTGQAGALEPGVHVDPGSPAAKQYALPLTQARTTGSGAAPSPGHTTGTSHTSAKSSERGLFGEGIVPKHGVSNSTHVPASHSATNRGGMSSNRGRGGARSHNSPAMARHRAAQEPAGYVGASARAPGSSDTLLALLGGGVAVLLVGALGGVILRQSHGGSASGG